MKKRSVKKRGILKSAQKTAPKRKRSKKTPPSIPRKSLKTKKINSPSKKSVSKKAEKTPKEFVFPAQYGEARLTLMARDPWWLYAYWEIPPKIEREALSLMAAQSERNARRVLRVYRQTGVPEPSFFDIEVGDFSDNWYVEVGVPGELWISEIGLRSADGRFYRLLRSNPARTPRYGVSEVVDPEWCLPEGIWRSLFEASGAFSDSQSSFDIATGPLEEKN